MSEDGSTRVLFVTWDGPGQSYLESLFLPLFAALKVHGVVVHVLQLCWSDDVEIQRSTRASESLGVPLEVVRVPRALRTVALPLWIGRGARHIVERCRRDQIHVVMPRSIIPAAMALGALRRARDVRLLYEADGLTADERVDFAGWSGSGAAYRLFREVELQALREAAAVATRTERARSILLARAGARTDANKIYVIPNAKDETSFAPLDSLARARLRERAGVAADAPWLVYAGSVGPQYHVPEMFETFRRVRRADPRARFHLLTWQRSELAKHGPMPEGASAETVEPHEIAAWLGAADAGIALRTLSFSQQAVCPIKLVEYLLCGTPVIASPVGDFGDHLSEHSLGHVVPALASDELERASQWFVAQTSVESSPLRERCRAFGVSRFTLSAAASKYRQAMERAMRSPAARESDDSGPPDALR